MRVEWRVYTFPPSSVLARNSKSETKFFEPSRFEQKKNGNRRGEEEIRRFYWFLIFEKFNYKLIINRV